MLKERMLSNNMASVEEFKVSATEITIQTWERLRGRRYKSCGSLWIQIWTLEAVLDPVVVHVQLQTLHITQVFS